MNVKGGPLISQPSALIPHPPSLIPLLTILRPLPSPTAREEDGSEAVGRVRHRRRRRVLRHLFRRVGRVLACHSARVAADERGGQCRDVRCGVHRDQAHAAAAHRGDGRRHAIHREALRARARSGIGNRESGIEGTGNRALYREDGDSSTRCRSLGMTRPFSRRPSPVVRPLSPAVIQNAAPSWGSRPARDVRGQSLRARQR